jgi:hypothetical protein
MSELVVSEAMDDQLARLPAFCAGQLFSQLSLKRVFASPNVGTFPLVCPKPTPLPAISSSAPRSRRISATLAMLFRMRSDPVPCCGF